MMPWCLRRAIEAASSACSFLLNLIKNSSGWCLETVTSPRRKQSSSSTTASISLGPVVGGALMAITTSAMPSHSWTSCSRSREVGTRYVASFGLVDGSPILAILLVRVRLGGGGSVVWPLRGGDGAWRPVVGDTRRRVGDEPRRRAGTACRI